MSNECFNLLTISGPTEEVQRFITAVSSEDETLADVDIPVSDVTEWKVETTADGTQKASVQFLTDWEPADDWVKGTAPQFPALKLHLEYDSDESDFAGNLIVFQNIAYDHRTTYAASLTASGDPWYEQADDYRVEGDYNTDDEFTVVIPVDYDDEVPNEGDWFRDFQVTRVWEDGDNLHISYRKQEWRSHLDALVEEVATELIPTVLNNEELLEQFPFLNQLKDGTVRDAELHGFDVPEQRENNDKSIHLAQVTIPLDGVEDTEISHWHEEDNAKLVTFAYVKDGKLTFTAVEQNFEAEEAETDDN